MLPILLILFASFIAVFVYLGIKPYRSPIKHIPEPPGAWPLVGHSPSFFRTSDHLALHEKWTEDSKEHGMYRLRHPAYGLDFVMITKPEWAKHILSRPEDFIRDEYLVNFFPKLGNSLLSSKGDEHRFQKKILAKSFTTHHVMKFLPVFDKHVEVLVQLWKSKTQTKPEGENIEVQKFTNNLSFDIISDVAFGYQADSQINEETRFVKSFRQTVEAMANFKKRTLRHLFPFLRYLPFGLHKLLDYEADQILDKLLAARRRKIINNELTTFEENDLLSNMVESTDEATGKSFTDELIKDSCFTFLFAGFETVSTAIPIVLYHLCQYPEMQEKVRKEIQSVFKIKDDEMTNEKLNRLRYTEAFIRESLRLFPTAPVNARKNTKNCQFGNYHIPKGTLLFMLAYHSNTDPEIFDFPDEFLPERYLEGSSLKAGTTLSFGYGPYNCIGKHFAMQEIKVSITRLLQYFKFTMDTENNKFSRMPVIAVRIDPPFKIRVQRLDQKQ